MMKNKKSQSLSINVIIIAALGLIVLFVLIAIFSGQTSKTVSTLESCGGAGGRCAFRCSETEIEKPNTKCTPSTQKCCIKIYEDIKRYQTYLIY